MPSDDADWETVLDVLRRRADLLWAVSEDPRDVRDLRDALDVSRSTVYKGVRELEALGAVEQVDGAYRPTLFGRLLRQHFETFVDDVAGVCENAPLLTDLAADLGLHPALFADADVVVATAHDPDRPVDALERFVARSARVASLVPVVRARYLELAAETLVDGAVALDLVTEQDLVEYAITHHREMVSGLLACESVRLHQTPADIRFGLVLREPGHAVGVTLYDDERMRAFLSTEHRDAVRWGRETFERYRADATELHAPR